jgi:hypothetical protein
MTSNSVITGYITGTRDVPGEARLDIYRNAYRERLIETLSNDYEILAKLLGEEPFRRLCIAYIDKNPSRHYSLRFFGSRLPSFLDYSSEKGIHDWEAEMAQLEWLFTDAFDSANALTVTERDAAAIPPDQWPTLSVTFHPSVRMARLWWNTLDLWQTAKKDEQPPEPVRLTQYSHCLLWRNNLVTQFRSLDNDEAVALSAAANGANFSEICGALAEELHDPEQVPIKAASLLKGWLSSGMLTELCT